MAEVRFLHNEDIPSIAHYQRAIREWRPGLDVQEFCILMELIDRSIGWGKWVLEISQGRVYNGDKMYAGLRHQMARSTFDAKLKTLRSKGVVRIMGLKDRSEIEVNTRWRPEMAGLPVPKRLKNGAEKPSSVDHWGAFDTPTAGVGSPDSRGAVSREPGTIEHNRENEVRRTKSSGEPCSPGTPSAPDGPAKAKVEAALADARQRNAAARAGRTARAKKRGSSGADYEAIWRSAEIEIGEGLGHTGWTQKQMARMRQIARLYTYTRLSFTEFLEWSVLNWPAIISRQFSWMTRQSPPRVPNVEFFLNFYKGFIECHAEQRLEGWLVKGEADRLQKLKASGMSHEEALAEIGRRRAARGMREEMTKREQKVRGDQAMAARRLDEAKRLQEQAEKPLDPRSKAAKELLERLRREQGDAPARPRESDETLLGRELSAPALPARNPFDD